MPGLRNSVPRFEEQRWLALICFLMVTFLVAGVSAALTAPAIPGWYAALAKPSFNPPNEIFGPVWTILYFLMAIAAWLVWRRASSGTRSFALFWWWMQLALNFLWSLLFFQQHRIGFALLEVVALWMAIAATIAVFTRLRKVAAWILVPYLAWVTFAMTLNFEIWRLN